MNWTEYTKLLIEKGKKAGIPASACFELTPFCNFTCNMCYIRLSPEQAKLQGELLTLNQWLQIAEETKRLGVIGLELTGGEAVTRSDFMLLYENLIKKGFIITLRSNGYHLKGDLFDLLKHYKPKCLSITLYGASDETYNKVAGVKDGFTVVSQNILALRDAGIQLKLSVTITKDNINDREQLIKWATENDLYLSFYGGLLTPIRSAKRSIDHLKVDYKLDRYIDNNNLTPRNNIYNDKYMHPFWMCREYGVRFSISWDGRMTLCNCFPSVWTDPLNQPIKDAVKSLYEKLEKLKRPSQCAKCEYIDYCGACPARLLSATGNPEETNNEICEMAKINYIFSQKSILQTSAVDTNLECDL